MNARQKDLLYNYNNQTFLGCIIRQYWSDLVLWERLITHEKPKTIIELGTAQCGLSVFLALQAFRVGAQFYTFDNKKRPGHDSKIAQLVGLEFSFERGDIFKGKTGARLVKLLCKAPKPLLLFCDNGDKPRELTIFVPELSRGDVVGVHDWGKEINDSDVAPVTEFLEPIDHDLFQSVGSITRFWKMR